ncbi:Arm DNA-binding domain-containing protein [Sphaerisporangium dianthi]|uniref:Arm DNA-binding domain-containing protein n=1 Tax=Sphaerisporangium dianthi TaxID=1436120 RepID=A0ABV9C9N6_9ACTN
MTIRRSKGDGGLHWDEARQRWIASVTVGYTPAGKRIVKKASGKTKTEAKAKLKEIIRDYEDGLAIAPADYTVERAVNDWLAYGLNGRHSGTLAACTILCSTHVIPSVPGSSETSARKTWTNGSPTRRRRSALALCKDFTRA